MRDSYPEVEFDADDNAGAEFANNANTRLVNYCVLSMFSSVQPETSGKKLLNIYIYIYHCYRIFLMY